MTSCRATRPASAWSCPRTPAMSCRAALEHGIRQSIDDPAAVVSWYPVDDEGDYVIVVKQAHATWWTSMPSSFAEMIGGYYGTTTLRWRDDEPPKADDDDD